MFKTYRFVKRLVTFAAIEQDLNDRQACLDRIRYNHANNGKLQLVMDRVQTDLDERRDAHKVMFDVMFV
jgi:hypothetical protein